MQKILYKNKLSHSVCGTVLFDIGASSFGESNCGLAHLIEHMFFRASGNLNQEELYRTIEQNGIYINGIAGENSIQIIFKCLPSKLSTTCKLIAGMFTAEWTSEMLALEKEVVKAEIIQKGSNYSTLLSHELLGTTKNLLGTLSSISKLSLKKVREGRKAVLGSDVTFIVAGNFNEEDYSCLLNALESFPPIFTERHAHKTEFKKLVIKPADYNAVSLSFVFDKQRIDYRKLELFKSTVFDGTGAPVSLKLREKLGYTYEIDADIIYSGERGVLNVYFEVQEVEDIINSITCLFDLLKSSDKIISDDTIRQSKPFYTDTLDFIYDDNEETVRRSAYSIIDRQGLFDIETEKREYARITVEDLKNLLQQLLEESDMQISIMSESTRKIKAQSDYLLSMIK